MSARKDHHRTDYNARLVNYPMGGRNVWCNSCGAKITVGTDGETEYGHYADCEHRNVDRNPSNNKGPF